MDGRIDVESNEGTGSRFEVVIPFSLAFNLLDLFFWRKFEPRENRSVKKEGQVLFSPFSCPSSNAKNQQELRKKYGKRGEEDEQFNAFDLK